MNHDLWISLAICIAAAALEGICAGTGVKRFFSQIRLPRYSAPLWVWSIIGFIYYLLFGFVIYRLLRIDSSALKPALLSLVIAMMAINAATNYLIFRRRDLRLSYVVGTLFPLLDIALFLGLVSVDRFAAWPLVPYLLYRIYAVWWGYQIWQINKPAAKIPSVAA